MKIVLGKETVITRGIRPEEQLWGPYQFPIPYQTDDGIVVSVHVADDNITTFGTRLWFKSKDGGETWEEVPATVENQCGLLLPNGDRVSFPLEKSKNVSEYRVPDWHTLTPAYDYRKQAEEGTLPIQDGITGWLDGTVIKAYLAERLPPSLNKKIWTVKRLHKGSDTSTTEQAEVDWPFLTRVVFTNTYQNAMKSIHPQGVPKKAPDGSVWISAYSGEGHINPENKQYSPYYSAELFRSEDDCHSFSQVAHLEYEADGKEYPYQSGGFSDSDFEFMADGSIVWFLRSTWAMSTGREWAPMYMTRSVDGGKSWSKPKPFAFTGIYPRLCKLDCGTVLICYARPGIFVQACDDGCGKDWGEPIEVMTPKDRSHLGNVPVEQPLFHEWDGSCNNPTMIAVDQTSALLFYSDFYYPDESGIKRKTILCRKITVEK